MNQNPIVPVNIEKPDYGKQVEQKQMNNNNYNQSSQNNISSSMEIFNDISNANSKKKIVSKFVEVTVKTIITYEDGSKKETTEVENHTYK